MALKRNGRGSDLSIMHHLSFDQKMAPSNCRILILHTGGTFGDQEASLDSQLRQKVPEIFCLADLKIEVMFHEDSSNLCVNDWSLLAVCIEQRYADFDAFIIIHGTDTLAYCGSFLSLAFSMLSKPIILTGSQRPLAELRSDARMNIIDSVQLAVLGFPEVMVCFNSDVFLGSRVSKVSNLDLGAFHSPNFPQLGHFGVEVLLNRILLPQKAKRPGAPSLDTRADSQVLCLSVVPGLKLPVELRRAITNSTKGLLFEGFGLGHAPIRNQDWVSLAREACEKEIPVVMTSQCRSGHIDMNLYEVGKQLAAEGVISAFDMTRECATIKLMMMIARLVPFKERFEFMRLPLSREISLEQDVYLESREKDSEQ